LILICIGFTSLVKADYLGLKRSDETIVIPIHPPLDSAGIVQAVDSIQVFAYADNGSTVCYEAGGAGYSCAGIDTTCLRGGTGVWLVEQINNIDGAGGNIELAVQVVTWTVDLPTYTFASMQVLSDSLNALLAGINVDQINGSNIAAENLAEILDGDGDGAPVRLTQLHIEPTGGDSAALYLKGCGTGQGIYAEGGSTSGAAGVEFKGGSTAGNGLNLLGSGGGHGLRTLGNGAGDGINTVGGTSTGGYGLHASGGNGGDNYGIYVYGQGDAAGLYASGSAGGSGAEFRGGSSGGYGLYAHAQANGMYGGYFLGNLSSGVTAGGHGLVLQGGGPGDNDQGGYGLYCYGGSGNGHGLLAVGTGHGGGITAKGGPDTGHGINAEGGDNGGHGINATASGGDYAGIFASGHGTGRDFNATIDIDDISGQFDSANFEAGAISASIDAVTLGAMADSVWDKNRDGHTTTGSFGYFIDTQISSVSSPGGSGLYPVTIIAFDSSLAQVIPGARAAVYNAELTAMIASGVSDSEGILQFNLDAGDYVIAAAAPGYIFSVYDTMAVSSSMTDTIAAYSFDPGQPAVADLCRVYGFVYGIDGTALDNISVTAQLSGQTVRYGNMIITPYQTETVTDTAGYFYLDLIPSDSLTPTGTGYLISVGSSDGAILKKEIVVPDSENWQVTW